MRHVPFILFVIAIVGSIYACVHEENARNQGLPLVNAAAPNDAKANMLFTPCALGPQNVPHFEEKDDA